jgi:hypothetical protein
MHIDIYDDGKKIAEVHAIKKKKLKVGTKKKKGIYHDTYAVTSKGLPEKKTHTHSILITHKASDGMLVLAVEAIEAVIIEHNLKD